MNVPYRKNVIKLHWPPPAGTKLGQELWEVHHRPPPCQGILVMEMREEHGFPLAVKENGWGATQTPVVVTPSPTLGN